MTCRRICLGLCRSLTTPACALMLSVVLDGGQLPPRDAAAARTGTAALSGTVMTAEENSRPIGRAVVELAGAELRPNLLVIADDSGRFVFSGLPAGRFILTASKPPYLTMSYGQPIAGGGSGVPISVRDGQQISDVSLKLPRGAVISGRVLDERGQPMRRSSIALLEGRTINGERTLTKVPTDQLPRTDVNGQYRVYGLPPGEYYVCAYPPGEWMVVDPSNVAATGDEVRRVGPKEIQWAMELLQHTQRGANAETVPEPPAGRSLAYGILYYPGTADPGAATGVVVGPGEEKGGIDFSMFPQPTTRIEGRVVGPDGEPSVKARVSLGHLGTVMGAPSANGAISYSSLLPGRYTITAQSADSTMWARREILVNGEDVIELVLPLQPGLAMAGRIVFKGTVLQPPTDLTVVRLSLSPIQAFPTSIPVRADGTFQVTTIAPGSYRLMAALPNTPALPATDAAPRWMVGSAIVNGRDVSDLPFEISSNDDFSNVVVTFTDRSTELSGTVLGAQGRPAPGSSVIVFSTDKTFWVQGTRRLPAPARSATDGRFRFTGLPPGEYYLVALGDVDQSKLPDQAFLSHLAASAITVTLADGEKKLAVEIAISPR